MFKDLKVGDIEFGKIDEAFDTLLNAVEIMAKELAENEDFPQHVLAIMAIHEMALHGALGALLKAATERMEKEIAAREPKEIRIPFPVRSGEKS